jgi:Protein of unknown function (DUF3987)
MAITGEIKMTPSDVSGPARVREIIDAGEELKLEAPRPLMRELPPADPFPVDALGEVLAPAARAINDRVQAPLAICGQSVLAAANLATQALVDVVLPIGGAQAKPVSSFFVTVALSGERKSACDQQAGWPIRKRENELRDTYDVKLPDYINTKAAWDKAREAAIKRGKGNRVAIKAELDAVGPPPVPPLAPLLTCPEPTYEGMVKHLAVGQPNIGIFATEGGQFIGGHGMRNDAKLFTAAGLSAAWDGDPIKRVRAGDGTIILVGRRVAMHLLAQPGVADILFRDPLLADQGLLSRLLVTAPPSAAGSRLSREERPETDRDLKRYGAPLLTVLEAPLPLFPGKTNELEPRPLPLTPEAQRLWFSFADYIEEAIAQGGPLEPVRGLANKLPEHAARLAAVLSVVRDLDSTAVGGHWLGRALRRRGSSPFRYRSNECRVVARAAAPRLVDASVAGTCDLLAGSLPTRPELDPGPSCRSKARLNPRRPWVDGANTCGHHCCRAKTAGSVAYCAGVLIWARTGNLAISGVGFGTHPHLIHLKHLKYMTRSGTMLEL